MLTVQLADGRRVPCDSEAYRHESECLAIWRMPLEQRQEHMAKVQKARGEEEVARIGATMKALRRAGAA